MTETELLYISYNPTDDTIDFGVKTTEAADRVLRNRARDVSARLRDLADRLDRGEYPFGRVSMVIQHCQGDPEDTRNLLLGVVRQHMTASGPRCLECGYPLTKNDPPDTDKCKSCYEDYER